MEWLRGKRSSERVRLRVMQESGTLVDEANADVVQTQIIARTAEISIEDQKPVPLYYQTEENRTPVWGENIRVETGLAEPPGTDSLYMLDTSRNLSNGIRTGAVEIDPGRQLTTKHMGILAVVAACVVAIAFAWAAGLSARPDATEITQQGGEQNATTVDSSEGVDGGTQGVVGRPQEGEGGENGDKSMVHDGGSRGDNSGETATPTPAPP